MSIIDDLFAANSVDEVQARRINEIRKKAQELAELIDMYVPEVYHLKQESIKNIHNAFLLASNALCKSKSPFKLKVIKYRDEE